MKTPQTYKEALESPQSEKWIEAMDNEIASIRANHTWDLTYLPHGRKPIGAKWVYKIKRDETGNVLAFKARLVAKGFVQKKGIDYWETFAPVAKMTSIRVIFAIAAHEGWDIQQMDVNSAYLKGEIDTDLYMAQPQGYVDKDFPSKVCKLLKGLYGLKQAGRLWNATLSNFFVKLKFKRTNSDSCVYIGQFDKGICILCVYVDDMIITGPTPVINHIKQQIAAQFDVKDLGTVKHLLGLQVKLEKHHIRISQSTYTSKLIEDMCMMDAKPSAVPAVGGIDLDSDTPEGVNMVSSTHYRYLIGKLMYAMVSTRPDIAFATGFLGKYARNPDERHLDAAKVAIKYLVGTKNAYIEYKQSSNPLKIEGYCDSDYAGDLQSRKSTSGYVFMLNGAPISWSSKRQGCVATSSTEAEYMAASHAAKEAIWLRRLMGELGYPQKDPTIIHEDSTGCIGMSKNPIHHSKTKHIDVQYHFIRERVEKGEVILQKITSQDQIADAFTKPLDRVKFTQHMSKLIRL